MTKQLSTAAPDKAGWVPSHRTSMLRQHINLAEIALLLALILALVPFVRYGSRVILYAYPVDYGEGPLLDQVRRLAALESIYPADLTSPPFIIANYPPLFPLVQLPFYLLFGPAFWYGRAISWVATVAAGLFVGLTARNLTRDSFAGVIAGLTLLTVPFVLTWAPLCRVDGLALALSWAGLFVITRWPERQWGIIGAAMLLTGAVYTRQSYGLAAPAAAFVWLLRRGQRGRALGLAGLVGGCGGLVFLLLNGLTRGGFFFNIVTANVNVFQLPTLLHHVRGVVVTMPLLLICGGLFLFLGGWPMQAESWWLAAPYLIGSVATAATTGKIGSNVNYLLEFSAALGLTAGCLLAWLRGSVRYQPAWGLAVCVYVVPLLLTAQIYAMARTKASYAHFVVQRTEETLETEVLLKLIRETEDPVLTGQHMGLLALESRPIYHQPFEMRQLARSGAWDQAPMLEALEAKRFPLILMYRPPGDNVHERRCTPEMLGLVQAEYRSELNISHTLVYRPRE